jgi:hypothetical protein
MARIGRLLITDFSDRMVTPLFRGLLSSSYPLSLSAPIMVIRMLLSTTRTLASPAPSFRLFSPQLH